MGDALPTSTWATCKRPLSVLPPPVESYVDRFGILDEPAVLHRLAVWEFKTRVETNNSPIVAEYLRRFPEIEGLDEELAHFAPQPLVLGVQADRLSWHEASGRMSLKESWAKEALATSIWLSKRIQSNAVLRSKS